MGLRQGLENVARARNEEKLNRFVAENPNLDWANPTAVRQQLGGLLDFTTQESKQNFADRIAQARQKRVDDSALGLQAMQSANLGSEMGQRDALLPERLRRIKVGNELTKSRTDRLKELLPLEKTQMEESIETQRFNRLLGGNRDERADKELAMRQRELANREALGKLTAAEKLKRLNAPKKTTVQKAAEENQADKIKKVGYTNWVDGIVDKIETGLNQDNILTREIATPDRKLLRGAINNIILSDNSIAQLLQQGDYDSASAAIINALKEKGYEIDVGGGSFEWLRPSTWLGGTTVIKKPK